MAQKLVLPASMTLSAEERDLWTQMLRQLSDLQTRVAKLEANS